MKKETPITLKTTYNTKYERGALVVRISLVIILFLLLLVVIFIISKYVDLKMLLFMIIPIIILIIFFGKLAYDSYRTPKIIAKNSIVLYKDHFEIISIPIIWTNVGKKMIQQISFKDIKKIKKKVKQSDNRRTPTSGYNIEPPSTNAKEAPKDSERYLFGRFAYRYIDSDAIYIIKLKKPQFFTFYKHDFPNYFGYRPPFIRGDCDKLIIEISDIEKFNEIYEKWKEN